MKVALLLLCAFVATAFAAPQPPSTRIVGGQDAARHEFPFILSLQRRSILGISYSHICGASILSHTWAVTAAHCTQNAPSTYRVVAGLWELNEQTTDIQTALITFIANHPEYRPPSSGVGPHDISLLQLDRPLVWTVAVQPVVYPNERYVPGDRLVLAGWGSMGGTIFPIMPNRLQKGYLPKVPNQQCRSAIDAFVGSAGANPFDEWSNICSGPLTGGQSACSGDSGGPWSENGVLVGVVSWGINPCGTVGAPSVYARATSYLPWVRQYVPEI